MGQVQSREVTETPHETAKDHGAKKMEIPDGRKRARSGDEATPDDGFAKPTPKAARVSAGAKSAPSSAAWLAGSAAHERAPFVTPSSAGSSASNASSASSTGSLVGRGIGAITNFAASIGLISPAPAAALAGPPLPVAPVDVPAAVGTSIAAGAAAPALARPAAEDYGSGEMVWAFYAEAGVWWPAIVFHQVQVRGQARAQQKLQ